MKEAAKAYLQEAKWYNEGYVPTMEEYMKIALVTANYKKMAINSFIGMGELVTKEAMDWVSNNPLIVRASTVICRLTDDMVGNEVSNQEYCQFFFSARCAHTISDLPLNRLFLKKNLVVN